MWPYLFFELNKWHKVVEAPLQIQYMTFETQAAQPEKANKSHFPSLLITPSTIARLTTWQACLTAGISFLIWEAGAPEKKKRLGAWTVTQCHCEKEQSGLRDSNIWLYNDNWIQSWQNTSVSRSANPPIRQTRPDKTIRLKLFFYNHNQRKSSCGVGLCQVCFY